MNIVISKLFFLVVLCVVKNAWRSLMTRRGLNIKQIMSAMFLSFKSFATDSCEIKGFEDESGGSYMCMELQQQVSVWL